MFIKLRDMMFIKRTWCLLKGHVAYGQCAY